MKNLFNNIKMTFTVVMTGFCLAMFIFVIAFIMHMSGAIDLEKGVHNMTFAAQTTMCELENEYNEKIEEIKQERLEKKMEEYRIKELEKEYNKRLDELNDWYNNQR